MARTVGIEPAGQGLRGPCEIDLGLGGLGGQCRVKITGISRKLEESPCNLEFSTPWLVEPLKATEFCEIPESKVVASLFLL